MKLEVGKDQQKTQISNNKKIFIELKEKVEINIAKVLRELRDQNKWVRKDAVFFLAQLKDPTLFPYLKEALEDKEDIVKIEAIWAAGELKEVRALPYLFKALEDKNDYVKTEAMRAIWKIKKDIEYK